MVLFLALPEAPDMALGTPSHGASTSSMLLSPCLFTMLLVSSSSLYLYGFGLFLSADNSQIHTSSPFEPQTFDSNDSWTSLLGWEAVGFTAPPPAQLLKPEAAVSSLTHLPCLTPQRSSSKSRGFYLLSLFQIPLLSFHPYRHLTSQTSIISHLRHCNWSPASRPLFKLQPE